ncbi:hypothetical protein [Blastomonas sp. AAP53]|uniref:hypothetical protein n=1 Tax=Blastomonas sp. AAP53 TaxID=1248760 RepID=UPI00030D29A4|nr:hypothetical protein [Blastomonas sp. AAP53]
MIDRTQMLDTTSHPLPDHGHSDQSKPNMRMIDWIWTVRGSVPLAPGQSAAEAFDRLEPFFLAPGTSFDRAGDTLTFTKKDQLAQDRMSIYDEGILQVEQNEGGALLRYRMVSKALLFCFLAPLLFVAFGQLIVGIGLLEGPPTAAEKKLQEEKKKEEEKKVRTLHPIDQFLGAPAPEKPKKDEKSKEKDKEKEQGNKQSPTSAYVFAVLFAILYGVGRVLEDRLINIRFRRSLSD